MRLLIGLGALLALAAVADAPPQWSEAELGQLRSLSIATLGPPPADPTNRVADDPAAAALGAVLFSDARLSRNGQVSCASCHVPERGFVDRLAVGRGVADGNRRTMPIAPAVHSPWQFWDGRADSLWAQALGPIENPVEHGFTRLEVADVVRRHHRAAYEGLFGPLPPEIERLGPVKPASPLGTAAEQAAWAVLPPRTQEAVTRLFVNVGKAIAAFERTQRVPGSRFDSYVAALVRGERNPSALTRDEVAGLRLFIGKGQCTRCHNGPLLTNHGFANTGVPKRPGLSDDRGRSEGVKLALADPFNCRGRFSDSPGAACDELDFAVTDGPELLRAYKVPSLRGVAERAQFMHAGQFANLDEVLDHYSRAPAAPAGHSELARLDLSARERRQLIAFLRSLSPVAVEEVAARGRRGRHAE